MFTGQRKDIEQTLQTFESRSTTPTISKEQQALNWIQQAQFNRAFETVLSAADLSLVLFVCQQIRAEDLFARQPVPLQVPVLLSLIQQLAADLTAHQELKYRLKVDRHWSSEFCRLVIFTKLYVALT
jgi:hypothetical protein